MHKYMYMIRPHLEQLMGRIGTFHDEKVAITQLSVTVISLKALGQYISGIRLLNLNTAVTEQVNGNSTT